MGQSPKACRLILKIKSFMKKEPGHEKSPVDFPVAGFGVGWRECGLC